MPWGGQQHAAQRGIEIRGASGMGRGVGP
jgi:hypothetical protein